MVEALLSPVVLRLFWFVCFVWFSFYTYNLFSSLHSATDRLADSHWGALQTWTWEFRTPPPGTTDSSGDGTNKSWPLQDCQIFDSQIRFFSIESSGSWLTSRHIKIAGDCNSKCAAAISVGGLNEFLAVLVYVFLSFLGSCQSCAKSFCSSLLVWQRPEEYKKSWNASVPTWRGYQNSQFPVVCRIRIHKAPEADLTGAENGRNGGWWK